MDVVVAAAAEVAPAGEGVGLQKAASDCCAFGGWSVARDSCHVQQQSEGNNCAQACIVLMLMSAMETHNAACTDWQWRGRVGASQAAVGSMCL